MLKDENPLVPDQQAAGIGLRNRHRGIQILLKPVFLHEFNDLLTSIEVGEA